MKEPSEPKASLTAVLDCMSELVLLRDAQGRVSHVNDAFLTAFGGARQDWIGRWFAVAPAIGENGEPRRYDAAMRTRSGPVWIEWSESAGPDGGSVAIGRDVSDERRARAEESEAARGKSVFFASVTHELRTPLSGALGSAGLLADTGLRPDQSAYLDAVRSSAEHALNLIDDILDLSRLEAGRLALRVEPVDPRSLIEDVCEILAPRAADKGLALAHTIARDVPTQITADPARLRQILFNLAGNAIKFTEAGGVLVTGDYADGKLRLAVRDSGPGIEKTDQARLFEYFERGAAERAATPGAGLGLAMVRRLCEAMEGEVGVQSEPGQGALFWCTLPAEVLKPAPADRPLSGRTVIVASPAEFQRDAIARQAAALGATAQTAASADAASAMLASAEGAVTVVLDERWSEAADALKSKAPDTRILALAEPRTKDLFSQSRRPPGIDGWLVAPVRLNSLAAFAQGVEPAEPEADAPDPAVGGAQPLRGLRLLLAEDDPVNAMIARTVLNKLGAEVTHVQTGRAAVEAASGGGFDAALLDLRMPELGGLEAAEAIRGLDAAAGLPLIALTANATEADRADCLAAGMDDFLSKPLNADALTNRLIALCAPQNRASFG